MRYNYDYFGDLYADRVTALKRAGFDTGNSIRDELGGAARSDAQLLQETLNATTEAQKEASGIGTADAEAQRLLALTPQELSQETFETPSAESRALDVNLAANALFRMSSYVPVPVDAVNEKLDILDSAARGLPAHHGLKLVRQLRATRDLIEVFKTSVGEGPADMLEKVIDAMLRGFLSSGYDKSLMTGLMEQMRALNGVHIPAGSKSKADWWRWEFIGWEACQFNNLIFADSSDDAGLALSVDQIAKAIGDPKDSVADNKGHPFFPMLFLLALRTESSAGNEDAHAFFVQELEKGLHIEYSALRDSLGLPHSSAPSRRAKP